MEKGNRKWTAIDIAKDELELRNDKGSWKQAYTKQALDNLTGRLKKLTDAWVICEASGGYERDLLGALHAAKIKVCLVSPNRIRAYAISEGIRAKTDKIDTSVMLKFAKSKNLRPTPAPSKEQVKLAALMDRRSQLSDALAQEKNHLQNSSCIIHTSIKTIMRALERQIQGIEKKIKELIEAHGYMRRCDELFQSVSGIGEVTSWSLIAYLNELGRLKRNEAVALVGLAPFNRDSGKSSGKRHIHAGRAKVRSCLYMAAQSAARYNPVIRPYVQRLKDKGKPYKCVMVAAMRKLLIHLQCLIKNIQTELA